MANRNELGQLIGDNLPLGWRSPVVPPRVVLEGKYVRVEPLDPERHASDLFEANELDSSGEGWTYLAYGPFESLVEYRSWMERACMGDDPMFWTYVNVRDNKAIGLGAFLHINASNATIEVGHLRFSPKLQRTVLATEAMYLKIKFAFELGYRRYEWKCDSLNLPSRKAAERLGFRFEGIFRQATHYRGRNRDTAWFSIIDKEWPALKSTHEAWMDSSNFDSRGIQIRSLSDFRDLS
tara:strand:+ start:1009 stop:1719 length:711 start_codon:yes stop_codon:yes gene_type:complete